VLNSNNNALNHGGMIEEDKG